MLKYTFQVHRETNSYEKTIVITDMHTCYLITDI